MTKVPVEGTGFINLFWRNTMTTATYRGIKYNVEERRMSGLQLIKNKLEKAEALKRAQIAAAKG